MKCEPGFCAVCELPIVSKCPTCSATTPNDQYFHVTLEMSNGSKMVIATCLACREKIHSVDKVALMEAIKTGWANIQLKNGWTGEAIAQYQRQYKGVRLV